MDTKCLHANLSDQIWLLGSIHGRRGESVNSSTADGFFNKIVTSGFALSGRDPMPLKPAATVGPDQRQTVDRIGRAFSPQPHRQGPFPMVLRRTCIIVSPEQPN